MNSRTTRSFREAFRSLPPDVRKANVQWGKIDLSDLAEMDFDEREKPKFRLKYDDILVCEGGEMGRTALRKDELAECYYQRAIHRLRPKGPNVLPQVFLGFMWLIFLVRQVPVVEGARSTIAHFPVEKLRILPFLRPSLPDQAAMVKTLSSVDLKLEAEQNRKGALDALFKSMLHRLIIGQSRVPVLDE